MGERKAVNKYYPPDWRPEHGSLDRYHGQHPLRERARKLGQGILIIRFEMPYNIWCGGCGIHIGMGVRYNAEKKKVGNYYTTPIYRFRMKCHLCDNHFEIETDPKNCDYVIVSGARRKEERWEPSATETVELTDKEDAKKMAVDAMFKLEHGVKDVQKSKAAKPSLEHLKSIQSIWKDDYAANQLLRNKFRQEKREWKAQEMKDDELRERAGLDVVLLPERQEDIELASRIKYHGEGFEDHRRKRRFEVNSRPLFSANASSVEKRNKIKELLGKRRKLHIDSFSSSSTTDSAGDLTKLGIKVRKNRTMNCEGEERRIAKDPGSECTRTEGDGSLCENSASAPNGGMLSTDMIRAGNALAVSKSKKSKGDVQNETAKESVVNNGPLELSNSNLSNPGHKSLVSCDYADSSDSSE